MYLVYMFLMRLSLHSDYALRCLMHLGINSHELCQISDISDKFSISRHHLVKVVHALGRHDFVATQRGRNGGIRLARDPSLICLGAVIRTTEPDFAIVECFRAENSCLITDACRLQRVLAQATAAFLSVLDSYTLCDLLADHTKLYAILSQGKTCSHQTN